MNPESERNRGGALDGRGGVRNPFGVVDVPDPNDQEVEAFAAGAKLDGSADDENASPWQTMGDCDQSAAIEGSWFSRWNGGVDPTIPGDAKNKWKQGHAEARTARERIYLLFDWNGGARRGLIDARRNGANRLVGKYINLTDPTITRPWTGMIVSNRRIDGRWSGGRLDFRR